jgi:hypothetical protein
MQHMVLCNYKLYTNLCNVYNCSQYEVIMNACIGENVHFKQMRWREGRGCLATKLVNKEQ